MAAGHEILRTCILHRAHARSMRPVSLVAILICLPCSASTPDNVLREVVFDCTYFCSSGEVPISACSHAFINCASRHGDVAPGVCLCSVDVGQGSFVTADAALRANVECADYRHFWPGCAYARQCAAPRMAAACTCMSQVRAQHSPSAGADSRYALRRGEHHTAAAPN